MDILDKPWSLQPNLKQARQSGILQNGVDYRRVVHRTLKNMHLSLMKVKCFKHHFLLKNISLLLSWVDFVTWLATPNFEPNSQPYWLNPSFNMLRTLRLKTYCLLILPLAVTYQEEQHTVEAVRIFLSFPRWRGEMIFRLPNTVSIWSLSWLLTWYVSNSESLCAIIAPGLNPLSRRSDQHQFSPIAPL